ncbi:MAG: hypothetical protein O3B47_03485 [bacterium]|nr:hypothetical protein [bacterium]
MSPDSYREHFTRRSCIPDYNKSYTIADLMDVIYVDINLRDIMDPYNLGDLENAILALEAGQRMNLTCEGSVRMVIEKEQNGNFKIVFVNVIRLHNERGDCCGIAAESATFGEGFMGLGGNSRVAPIMTSGATTIPNRGSGLAGYFTKTQDSK